MSENSGENRSIHKGTENLKPFKKGESGNPNGRPKGSLNYSTKMRLALEALAKSQDKTPEEVEEMIYRTGLRQALQGDWKFYEDYMNRLHGKPIQPTDITTDGQALQGVVVLPPKEQDAD